MENYVPVKLAYNVVEPDEYDNNKAPVIFLHGMTTSKENWHDIPWHIASITQRKVYVLDARNHGDSPWSEFSHFACNVKDLLHFMDTHYVSKAILVGHSMGGITAMKIALWMPERVEKLVVEDISVKTPSPQAINAVHCRLRILKSAIEELPRGLDEESSKEFISNYIDEIIAPGIENASRTQRNDFGLKKTADGRYTFKTNINVLPLAVNNSKNGLLSLLGRYEGPACFIYGQLSPFEVESHKDHIKKFFPKVELVGVENAGHEVHNDCGAEFSKILCNFILRE
ncbi:hypothetical protein TNCT_554941 [Trichonephila clavata]|uniref:sn-1-specific diacylglycerol lipase ABHD11 n=1 Tax=Trichonephila clavata TaxID=2740835 RepID=A0A8X6G1Y7_TRICU|nr:hypothetical protein TNCT_554941 [Trichonephila clavata]